MLVDLTVKEFLNKVAGSDPVPGGGSIAALNGAIASALAAMVANLTIGKKGYELHEELMRHISGVALQQTRGFVEDIDPTLRPTTRCLPASRCRKLRMRKGGAQYCHPGGYQSLPPLFLCRWHAMRMS